MKYLPPLALSIMIVSLGACGQTPGRSAAENQAASTNTQAPAQLGPSERLLAAAEPFEKLTEIAFTAPLPEIDKTIADARSAAESVRPLLSAGATNTDKLFLEIDRARKASDRAGLALASIEFYRGIVSSVPTGTKVPSAVSLLDYAGFRYQADLKASPTRWSDMSSAMRFAQSQWSGLKPKLNDAALATSFEKTLADMDKAIAKKDAALAASSVAAELNEVDKLEVHFAAQ